MSGAEELRRIVRESMPFPPEVIEAYARLEDVFTSGDLARLAGIRRSTAKFYVAKMVRLRMITKIPESRKYQKYANARTFSEWLKRKPVKEVVPFPSTVVEAYDKLGDLFTSGDLARSAGIPRSTAKFYIAKMVRLRMIAKVPGKKKYKKFAEAKTFSDWLKDLIRLAIVPLEQGRLG